MIQKEERAFEDVWNVIIKNIDYSFADIDPAFKERADARIKDLSQLHDSVEPDYKLKRHETKMLFYKDGSRERLLDSRKLGAVVCVALINNKPIVFDEKKAKEYALEKKDQLEQADYNIWACNNILINFKIAYLSSISLVYYSCMYCLNKNIQILEDDFDEEQRKAFFDKLKLLKRLCNYPKCKEFDSFGVNMIVSLARTSLSNNEIDIEMYALQLWQIEMYTYRTLELMSFNPDLSV